MKRCVATIEGLSPYSQSRKTDDVPMLDRESHDDYEKRVWRNKTTVNAEGQVCIPAMGFKQMLDTTAYKLGVKVPNRRGATFKNFFTSGFYCEADAVLFNGSGKPATPKEAQMVTISANSDGVRGSGKRVPRSFPSFTPWSCVVSFIITDDIIAPDIFEQHLRASGIIAGLGRFRPEKGGHNGRFRVTKIEWEDYRL